MNVAMWVKALRVIPNINKEEWSGLDLISRWLIATRSAVLIITFISAAIAGIFYGNRCRRRGGRRCQHHVGNSESGLCQGFDGGALPTKRYGK